MKQFTYLFLIIGITSSMLKAQTDSVAGTALYFNGSSDYVDTKFTDHLKTFTVTCWAKSPNAPTFNEGKGPVHYEQNFQLNWDHVQFTAQSAFVLKDSLGKWQAAKFKIDSAETWYYLAATYDGDTMKAYTNGILTDTNSRATGPPTQETNSVKIGKHAKLSGPAYEFHNGTVDEVRIYNRALTAQEIRERMHRTLDSLEPGLVLYYQFNDTTYQDSAYDAVRNIYTPVISSPEVRTSTAIVGKGKVFSQNINSTGTVKFDGTGVKFTVQTAPDTNTMVTVFRIESEQVGTAPDDSIYIGPNKPYWIINTYGDSLIKTSDLTFNTSFVEFDSSIFSDSINLAVLTRLNTSHLDWEKSSITTSSDSALSKVTLSSFITGQIIFTGSKEKQDTLNTGVSTESLNDNIHVYHSDNRLYLNSSVNKPFDILIYNLQGQIVYKQKQVLPVEIATAGFSNGYYVMNVISDSNNAQFIIIVQH